MWSTPPIFTTVQQALEIALKLHQEIVDEKVQRVLTQVEHQLERIEKKADEK